MGSSPWTVQYCQRVLATDPIAYWMLDEKAGAVAYDLVSGRIAGAQNGAHAGVVLGQDGIGDGRTCPLYDGANDYTNIYSATLNGVFDGDEGSLLLWARVSGAGIWTDATQRKAAILLADANNFVRMQRHTGNNLLEFSQVAGGTVKTASLSTGGSLGWMCLGLTWSLSTGATGEVRLYYNGVQSGATLTGLGTWAGNLSNTGTVIGALNLTPNEVWSGYLAHGAVWDRAISAAEVADLAVVE
jgi:hypothetical protein